MTRLLLDAGEDTLSRASAGHFSPPTTARECASTPRWFPRWGRTCDTIIATMDDSRPSVHLQSRQTLKSSRRTSADTNLTSLGTRTPPCAQQNRRQEWALAQTCWSTEPPQSSSTRHISFSSVACHMASLKASAFLACCAGGARFVAFASSLTLCLDSRTCQWKNRLRKMSKARHCSSASFSSSISCMKMLRMTKVC